MNSAGDIIAGRRIPTPRDDCQGTIGAIETLTGDLIATASRTAAAGTPRGGAEPAVTVGIGMPGSVSPATGRVQNANSTWLNAAAFREDVSAVLAHPVRCANDANCFALSEACDGAAAGETCVLGLILGTGVGAGIVVRGHILDGPRGTGGEWGHNPLPWQTPREVPGPACWCGRLGCIESWVSGPGMAADHKRQTGTSMTAEQIVALAEAGNDDAKATLSRHADRLARSLAHIVNIIDPDAVVLGGGLSALAHLYSDLPAMIRPHLFAADTRVDIRPPRWGDASGVRGAARLFDTERIDKTHHN